MVSADLGSVRWWYARSQGVPRWLARQMCHRQLGFVQHDNAFLELADPQRAQQLADGFANLPWVRQLDSWARKINPLLPGRGWAPENTGYRSLMCATPAESGKEPIPYASGAFYQ